MFKGHSVPGVVTGKPVEIGGSIGRAEATGRGVTIIAEKCLEDSGMEPQEQTYAIQGMGNVGGTAAKILYEEGKKVIAVSDWSGGVMKREGLDIPDILAFLSDRSKALKDYEKEGTEHISNEELLTCKCDVLFRQHWKTHYRKKCGTNTGKRYC